MFNVEFGPLQPDTPDFTNPGLVEADNVYPIPGGYGPFESPAPTDLTVTGTVIGAKRFDKSDGSRLICVATTSDLYVLDDTSSTASALSLSLASTDRFSFEQFGPAVFATTKSGDTYYLTDIDSDTTFSASPGAPPNANAMARVSDFLMMGDVEDIDSTDQPYRVRWSQFNNPQGDWTSDIATQADYVDMPTRLGPVTGIAGGEFGLIFQTYGVSRIQYTGTKTVFSKEVIDEKRGCASPHSIVQIGPLAYYLAFDGFCRTDGSSVEVISTGEIWDWFQATSDNNSLGKVVGVTHWQKKCIVWAFQTSENSVYSRQVIYNWEQDRWSTASQEVDYLVEGTSDGLTLEQLAAEYPNLDTVPFSLDSNQFKAIGRVFSGIVSGTLNDFLGTNLEATFITGDRQLVPGKRTFVDQITPHVENSSSNTQVSIGTRETLGGTITYSATETEGPLGFVPVAADGRYVRIKMTIPAGALWDKATGFQVSGWESGQT